MRNINLLYHIHRETGKQIPYFHIVLDKGVGKNNNDRFWDIVANSNEPFGDDFHYLQEWFNYLKLNGNFADDSYLFPRKYKGSLVFDSKPTSISAFNDYSKSCITFIGLIGCNYTSHTFRKGGARRVLMFSRMKWTI